MSATAKLTNHEVQEPNEASLIDRIITLQRKLHDKSGTKFRAQHPKHHGLAKGEFVVEPDLPEELRHGIFSDSRSYDVWLRFSNGRGPDDTRPTLHGLALKVTGVEHAAEQTTEQDFLMVDHPVFFIRNLQEYVALFEAQVSAKGGVPWRFFIPGINPIRWRIGSFFKLRAVRKKMGNALGVPYFSTTPYQLGPHAIKFQLVPHDSNGGNPAVGDNPDYLGERLSDHLKDKSASFDFRVLLQTDPVSMPVEDPTVDWQQAASAGDWRKVATIHLPAQDIKTEQRQRLAEDMAFSPWHTLDAQRPLGGINRARRAVYEALSNDRFKANSLPGPASPTEEQN